MLLALGLFLGFQTLILVHEGGHLLAARMIGARVSVFSMGFGKAIWSWRTRSGTTFQIARIPLGGYVEVEGEHASLPGCLPESGFWQLAIWRRAAFYLGGVIANIVFTLLLAWPVMAHLDRRVNLGEGVYVLQAGMAGMESLEPGDRVRAVNGRWLPNQPRSAFEVILAARAESRASNHLVTFAGERDGVHTEWRVPAESSQHQVPWITVGIDERQPIAWLDVTRGNVLGGLSTAAKALWLATGTILGGIVSFVFGVGASGDAVGGPLSVVQAGIHWAESGATVAILGLAITSLNMAVFNLLPVPMLDGGHLFFLWWEAATNRSIPGRVQVRLLVVGATLLLAFFLMVTLLDAARLSLGVG